MICIWLGVLLDLLIGDPVWFYHPVRIMGKYIEWFERLFFDRCKTKGQKKAAGLCMAVSLIGISYGAAYGILLFFDGIHPYLGLAARLILAWTCLALRCLSAEPMRCV